MRKNKLVVLATAVFMICFALATSASATPMFSGISGLDNGELNWDINGISGSNESSVSLDYTVGNNVTEALSSGILLVKEWNLDSTEFNLNPYWSVLNKTEGTLGEWNITTFLLTALSPAKAIDGTYSLFSTTASVADTQYPFGIFNGNFTGTAGSVLTMDCGWANVLENTPSAPVPEPATFALFGIGLLGLAGFGRKKQLK